MTSNNPLLTASPLPAFSQVRPEHVGPAIDALLAEQRAGVEALVASAAPRTWDNVMGAQERLDDRLARAWAPVSHLQSVADTPALRAAYNESLEKIARGNLSSSMREDEFYKDDRHLQGVLIAQDVGDADARMARVEGDVEMV